MSPVRLSVGVSLVVGLSSAILFGCQGEEGGSFATRGGSPAAGGGVSGASSAGDDAGTLATAGSGAAGGTAGALPVPYDYGFIPATVSVADATTAYESWKQGYLEDCGGGVYRVRWDEPTQTVSEGIAYGMLLSVIHDERPVFDGLWAYYEDNLDPQGLMHWQRGGCAGSKPTENSDNAATDADLDAAMALLMAGCRWSDAAYSSDADRVIAAIRQYETGEAAGLALLHPGDAFGGADCLNASYFSPGYYRAFAARASAADEASFWNKLALDSYTLIDRMDDDATALLPNWADIDGNSGESGPSGCTWYDEGNIFGSDAVRTPWRVAVDYLWWGTPAAQTWLQKLVSWVQVQGIQQVGRKYELDGTPFGEVDHSVISVGAFANAAMAVDASTADGFASEFAAVTDSSYFRDSLRALYLAVATGQFTPCGGLP